MRPSLFADLDNNRSLDCLFTDKKKTQGKLKTKRKIQILLN